MENSILDQSKLQGRKVAYGNEAKGQGGKTLPFSKAYRAGDYIFISGQIAMDADGNVIHGGIEEQTRYTMENIKKSLAMAGCELQDVVKMTVWLADVRDFWGFNKIYAQYFPENPPARSAVRADLFVDAKVEIEAIAYKPENKS